MGTILRSICDGGVSGRLYTTLKATGCWKSEETSAAIREDTRVIVVLAPSDAREKVQRIARQYRRLFNQEAVLIVTSPAEAEFVDVFSGEQP